MRTIAQNVEEILRRVEAACRRSGRNPEEIELVAVTKTVAPAQIEAALRAGVKHIGENRVQEAAQKKPQVSGAATWHMIGHLQTNKVKKALELFDVIQSVDSRRLADKLQEQCERRGRSVEVLVQVNTSGEESKFGVPPEEAPQLIEYVAKLPALRLTGLMTIGPLTDDEQRIRRSFRLLRGLFDEFSTTPPPGVELHWLSMGMTDDFEIAIEEGSNMIRVGRAIFGERN